MRPDIPAPKKSLGQHFLRDAQLCRRIAGLLDPRPDDCIIEIGPGQGALTRILDDLPHKSLLLLEKDRYWAREIAKTTGATAIIIDALRFDWPRLAGAWKIIGNLPYNVASPLIWDIFSQCPSLERAVFMVQKEVGQRLAARPGSGHYGALSVWVQSHARPRLEFTVGPGAFAPPPKVDSAVLSFTLLPLELRPGQPEALRQVLRLCFQNRRKQLGGIFKRANMQFMASALDSLGLDPALRPENLSPEDFNSLAQAYSKAF